MKNSNIVAVHNPFVNGIAIIEKHKVKDFIKKRKMDDKDFDNSWIIEEVSFEIPGLEEYLRVYFPEYFI